MLYYAMILKLSLDQHIVEISLFFFFFYDLIEKYN